jgi:hypothetical protein
MKPLHDFSINNTRKDGRSETCLACKRAYNKTHYSNNKKYYVGKAKKARDKLKSLVWERKLKCSRCPQDHPATLHFHHKDASKKEFTIAYAVSKGWSRRRVLAEIEKCEVMCANCHYIHHWGDKHPVCPKRPDESQGGPGVS